MSENIDCNLSIGVTESGKIGEDIIVGILSIDKDDEIKLIVNNLLLSNHLVSIENDTKHEESIPLSKKTVSKYIAKIVRLRDVGKTGICRRRSVLNCSLYTTYKSLPSRGL